MSRPASTFLSGARRFLFLFVVAVAIFGLIIGGAILFAWKNHSKSYFQSVYRMAPGTYELYRFHPTEKWGYAYQNHAVIPAFRITGPDHSFTEPDSFYEVSERAIIERWEPDKPVQRRPLSQALGEWVQIQVASPWSVSVFAMNESDARDNIRYTVHIPEGEPLLLGGSREDLAQALEELKDRDGALDAIARMDAFGRRLEEIVGSGSGLLETWDETRQEAERLWLLSSKSPEELAAEQLKEFKDRVSDSKSPQETLYLLSIYHGDALTAEQIRELKSHLGIDCAEKYSTALLPIPPPAEWEPLAGVPTFYCAAGKLPDDFEGMVRMLRWVYRDLRGPKIELISERSWTVGRTVYTERKFKISWQLVVTQGVRKSVGQSFRSQGSGKPAAERLSQALEHAGFAHQIPKGKIKGPATRSHEYMVARYKDMPSPRPYHDAHHGVMSVWMKNHYPRYNKNLAPTILLPREKHKAAHRYSDRWKAEMKMKMGGHFDWRNVSEKEIRDLSEKMLDISGAPASARQLYWTEFDRMLKVLRGK